MITMNHGCPFCGQVLAVQVKDDATEHEINEAAIKLCICEGAEKHKELTNARKNISELFGKASEAKFDDYFSIDVQEDLYRGLCKSSDACYLSYGQHHPASSAGGYYGSDRQ